MSGCALDQGAFCALHISDLLAFSTGSAAFMVALITLCIDRGLPSVDIRRSLWPVLFLVAAVTLIAMMMIPFDSGSPADTQVVNILKLCGYIMLVLVLVWEFGLLVLLVNGLAEFMRAPQPMVVPRPPVGRHRP